MQKHKTYSTKRSIKNLMQQSVFRESTQQQQQLLHKNGKVRLSYQDGLKIFKLNRKFLQIQFSLNLLWFLYFLLLFNYYEKDVNGQQSISMFMLYGIIIIMVGIGVCNYFRWNVNGQICKARNEQHKLTPFEIITQIIIFLTQPYPMLNQVYIQRISKNNQQLLPLKLNYLLIVLALPKLVYLFRGLINFLTPYSNPRYYRVTKIYGAQNNIFYHIRCLFKYHPVILISLLYLTSVFLFAICYKIFQYGADSSSQSRFKSMQNVLWLAILTMTTVGYGDIAPLTKYGGYVTLVSSYIGVIGTSLFVLAITNNFQINYSEQRSLHVLKRLNFRRIQKIKSGKFIRVCLWRLWISYKHNKKYQRSAQQYQLKRQLSYIRIQTKKYLRESSLFQQSISQQFEIVNCHIKSLSQNSQILLNQCTNKRQVIQGVISNLQNQNSKMQKNFIQKQLENKISVIMPSKMNIF